jgi:hypothetical protein
LAGESKAFEAVQKFLQDLSEDVAEERVVNYVIREVGNGRRVSEVLKDPFVKNRLSEQRIGHVLENPHVLDAVERDIVASYKSKDFEF